MMLSALPDGLRRLLLRMNCDCFHFCFFTAMTTMKNDVTIKKPWRLTLLSVVIESRLNSPRHFKNDKLFSFLCRWEGGWWK